ncbi:unnamed protein product [Cunninghamella blakesleeana]
MTDYLSTLPIEIVPAITSKLDTKDVYQLAVSSKHLWLLIRQIPLYKTFEIHNNNKIGTFFHFNVSIISMVLPFDAFSFIELRSSINQFINLREIYIDNSIQSITTKQAIKFINAINNEYRPVTVYAKQQIAETLKSTGSFKGITVSIISTTPSTQPSSNDIKNIRKRRELSSRIPSPVRKLLKSIDDNIEDYKKSVCNSSSYIKNNDINIPTHLISTITDNEYKNLEMESLPAMIIPSTKDDVDEFMKKAAPVFLESILINQSVFCFVTQFEAYLRDKPFIDDCAIGNQSYPQPSSPNIIVNTKIYKGKTWKEISLFWGCFEILITGGLIGSVSGVDGINGFLGPSLPSIIPSFNSTDFRIFVSTATSTILQRERRLRNYGKIAAGYLWSYHSKKYSDNGFISTHPLHLQLPNVTSSTSHMIVSAKLYSFLISKLIARYMNKNDIDLAIELFKLSSTAIKNLGWNTSTSVIEIKDQINQVMAHQDRKIIKILLKIYKHNTESKFNNDPTSYLTTDEMCNIYNGRLAQYCKSNDERILKKKLFIIMKD